jgi:hypothetical protein
MYLELSAYNPAFFSGTLLCYERWPQNTVERQTVNAYSQINKDNKTYKIKPPLITEVKSDEI